MAKIFNTGDTKIQRIKNINGNHYLVVSLEDKILITCYTQRLYISLPKRREKCLKELYLDFQL